VDAAEASVRAAIVGLEPVPSTPGPGDPTDPGDPGPGDPSEPSDPGPGTPTEPVPSDSGSAATRISELTAVITGVGSLQPANYTVESWAAFSTVLGEAVAVAAPGSTATAEQVAAAQARLITAVFQLVPVTVAVMDVWEPLTVLAVSAQQGRVTLVRGRSITLAALAHQSNGTTLKVAWKSSKPSVATVSARGKITAKKAGRATITATAAGKSVKIAVRVLSVKPARNAVTKVVAKGVPKTLAVGASRTVLGQWTPTTATSVKVTYSSSKPSVASIDETGRLIGKAKGSTVITVKAGAKSRNYKVTVK
jgi:hypothetical protein